MNKNLAIIGTTYLQMPLIERAKELGYVTHAFAWAANDVGEKAADYFYPISTIEVEKIYEKCKEIGICGICTIASDVATVAVNYVADRLGLSGNSMEATLKSTNKHIMREAFKANGDPSPQSILVDENTDLSKLDIQYPVIVKPLDRSGSRGVCKLETSDGLQKAVKAAIAKGFKKNALVEEFVEGNEYSIEGITFNGEHHILAITKKLTTGAPHFIETGHIEPAPIDEKTVENVKRVVLHALGTLGIKNSASHSEVKIDKDGTIKIIEIGGRMGGDFIGSDLVRYSTGIDYVRAVIQVACGIAPDLTPVCTPQPAEVRFILTEEDVAEFERFKKEESNRILKIDDYHPERVNHTTDSSNRAGCYIISRR